MKTRRFRGDSALSLLTILFVIETLVSGCVYRPDFRFPAPLDTGGPLNGPLAKAVIPTLPYAMTWEVNPASDQFLEVILDKKAAAFPFVGGPFPFVGGPFWDLIGGDAGASPFFDSAVQWRFTLFDENYNQICGGTAWESSDSNTITYRCYLSQITSYYGKALTAHIDYVYQKPKGTTFPFLSIGRTFYVSAGH